MPQEERDPLTVRACAVDLHLLINFNFTLFMLIYMLLKRFVTSLVDNEDSFDVNSKYNGLQGTGFFGVSNLIYHNWLR